MDQKQKVYQELDRLDIKYEIIEHPAVYTIEELDSLEEFHDNPCVAKNLFLRDASGKHHFLVVLDKDKKADLKLIRKQLGASTLSFSSEERLMEHLKLTKGSVTPLGIVNDLKHSVEVVMDSTLVDREFIGVHPNDNTATVILSYHDLCVYLQMNGATLHIIDL
ncbi:MAG: prolyl-tRNA synthetase associated domain-containing protein [Mobilitalea sp.]